MIRSIQSFGKLLSLFLLILLIFASCTDAGAGIFYSIEIEEEIDDGSMPNSLTAYTYAFLDDVYYLPGGKLYKWDSSTPSEDWSKVSLPSSWDYTWNVASNEPSATPILYAILENTDGDDTALYTWDSTNGWQGSYYVDDGRPYRLWYANGELYVATLEVEDEDEDDYNYMLYVASDPDNLAAGFTQITVDGSSFVSLNLPVKDLAYDGSSEILFITSDSVYSGSGSTFFEQANAAPSGKYLRNIHYSPNYDSGTYFISCADGTINEDGYVYKWDGSTFNYFADVGDDPNDFADVTLDGTNYYLVVGTKSGYYESAAGSTSFSGESDTLEDSDEYEITDLYSATVLGLFQGGSNDNIFFAMTSTEGLWRNEDGDWSRE